MPAREIIRELTEEADTLGAKKKWDKGLGQGREKIFEVRRVYNDVNFIDEFMTPEFIEKARKHGFQNLTLDKLIALKHADIL